MRLSSQPLSCTSSRALIVRWLAIAGFAVTFGIAAAVAAPGDDAIQDALDAYRTRNAGKLAGLVATTRGHLLGQYVEYWALRLNLEEQPGEAVRDFLDRYRGTYLADRLRGEWLRVLGKRGDWSAFRAQHPLLINEDGEITCHALAARQAQGDNTAWAELMQQWLQPRELPDACGPLVERGIADGRITKQQVWARIRGLGEMGQTGALKRTLGFLPSAEAPEAKAIDRIAANPQRAIERNNFDLAKQADRELYYFALGRLARRDPTAALGAFPATIQQQLGEADRRFVYGMLALWGARHHMPEALGWFAEALGRDLSDEHQAWRARAALRARNWSELRSAVEAMEAALRHDETWIYWSGRALRELNEPEEAGFQFARIAGQPHFYGQLAGEELGQKFSLPPRQYMPTAEDIKIVAAEPGLRRALALLRLELRTEAIREWNWAIRGWDDRRLIAAADLARREEVWDRAINTADRTVSVHDYGLRYLAPYRTLFTDKTQSLGLEESWVLGLTRQESRFIVKARSSAGASGLMQLMPGTARQVARKMGLKEYRWSNIHEPELNVQLGTKYLREVLDGLDGHPLLASAAYNAGPARAQRWRAEHPLEGAIYAETIPFNETRDYVKKVFANTMFYAAVLGGEAKSLKERLGVVPPRSSVRFEE